MSIPYENPYIRPSNNITTISYDSIVAKEGAKETELFKSIFPEQQSSTTVNEDEIEFTASSMNEMLKNFGIRNKLNPKQQEYLEKKVVPNLKNFISQCMATGKFPSENLWKVKDDGTVVKLNEIADVESEEFKKAPTVFGISCSIPKEGTDTEEEPEMTSFDVLVPTNEHTRRVLESNPNAIPMNLSQEMQSQIEQIVQLSVEKYVAYRLSLVQPEKEKESDKQVRNHHASSPQLYLQNAEEKKPVKPPEKEKVLNFFNQASLIGSIITINDILTARREEAKTEEIQKEIDEKKSAIVENEIEKQIRKSEIVKGTVQESEIHESELQREADASQKRPIP